MGALPRRNTPRNLTTRVLPLPTPPPTLSPPPPQATIPLHASHPGGPTLHVPPLTLTTRAARALQARYTPLRAVTRRYAPLRAVTRRGLPAQLVLSKYAYEVLRLEAQSSGRLRLTGKELESEFEGCAPEMGVAKRCSEAM